MTQREFASSCDYAVPKIERNKIGKISYSGMISKVTFYSQKVSFITKIWFRRVHLIRAIFIF